MNTFFKMTMAGAAMFALSALAVPATSLLLAQTAAPTKPPELSKADQEEKNRTVAQIRSAVEKSKGGQDFKMALEKKDYKAVGAILILHGAAADIMVGHSEAAGLHIKITCCSKMKWGPIIIEI